MSQETTQGVQVQGQDIVGGALPLIVQGLPVSSTQQTWGRLIRLGSSIVSGTFVFYDIGIDTNGNLFVNNSSSTETQHLLAFSGSSVQLSGIQPASSAPDSNYLESVLVDTNTGILYYQ